MSRKENSLKVFFVFLALALMVLPRLSYADWSVGVDFSGHRGHHDDRHFYRWHEHPHYGLHIGFLPDGYNTIWSGGVRYYYYDGLYYTYAGNGDYVLVNPPIGAYVTAIPSDFQPVLINGRTYYTDGGVYYILTRYHGYKIVQPPVVYAQPAVVYTQPAATVEPAPVPPPPTATGDPDAYTVNVPNNSGGYSTVVIKKSGNGYVGPQGEYYSTFPSVAQLKMMYVK